MEEEVMYSSLDHVNPYDRLHEYVVHQGTLKRKIPTKQSTPTKRDLANQFRLNPYSNLKLHYVPRHNTELKLGSGLNVSTRCKQLFDSRYSSQQNTIATKTLQMQKKLNTDLSHFSIEQKLNVYRQENHFMQEDEPLKKGDEKGATQDAKFHSDESYMKQVIKRIVLKDYLKQKMESSDQVERDLEISQLVADKSAMMIIQEARKQQHLLDEDRYEQELMKIKLRLGYYNKRKVQDQKLKLLASELYEAKQQRRKQSMQLFKTVESQEKFQANDDIYIEESVIGDLDQQRQQRGTAFARNSSLGSMQSIKNPQPKSSSYMTPLLSRSVSLEDRGNPNGLLRTLQNKMSTQNHLRLNSIFSQNDSQTILPQKSLKQVQMYINDAFTADDPTTSHQNQTLQGSSYYNTIQFESSQTKSRSQFNRTSVAVSNQAHFDQHPASSIVVEELGRNTTVTKLPTIHKTQVFTDSVDIKRESKHLNTILMNGSDAFVKQKYLKFKNAKQNSHSLSVFNRLQTNVHNVTSQDHTKSVDRNTKSSSFLDQSPSQLTSQQTKMHFNTQTSSTNLLHPLKQPSKRNISILKLKSGTSSIQTSSERKTPA